MKQSLVLAVIGGALSAGAGCSTCRAPHPPYQHQVSIAVAPSEPCPSRSEAKAHFGDSVFKTGDRVISIDGDGVRDVASPARQTCCYVGTFSAEGVLQSGDLCIEVTVDGSGEAPDALACPTIDELQPELPIFFHPRPELPPLGVFPEEVQELSTGPTVAEVVPRQDRCAYPATLGPPDDACG